MKRFYIIFGVIYFVAIAANIWIDIKTYQSYKTVHNEIIELSQKTKESSPNDKITQPNKKPDLTHLEQLREIAQRERNKVTYTYLISATGKPEFFSESRGFSYDHDNHVAKIDIKDPLTGEFKPVNIEAHFIVSPFKLP